jgi:hypothetical protein
VLTPSALERCGDPSDWLRREIETALSSQRIIAPLMSEGFDFGTPKIADQLTGKLAALKHYRAKHPAGVFVEAMDRLRDRYLNFPLTAVLHPAPLPAQQAATQQKIAANAARPVQERELTAQQWFERGFAAVDLDERLRFYSEAIRLKPDYAGAFNKRGAGRRAKGGSGRDAAGLQRGDPAQAGGPCLDFKHPGSCTVRRRRPEGAAGAQ